MELQKQLFRRFFSKTLVLTSLKQEIILYTNGELNWNGIPDIMADLTGALHLSGLYQREAAEAKPKMLTANRDQAYQVPKE